MPEIRQLSSAIATLVWLHKRVLLANGADDATFRPAIVRGKFILLLDHFVVLRQRAELAVWHHVHYFVAACLELAESVPAELQRYCDESRASG